MAEARGKVARKIGQGHNKRFIYPDLKRDGPGSDVSDRSIQATAPNASKKYRQQPVTRAGIDPPREQRVGGAVGDAMSLLAVYPQKKLPTHKGAQESTVNQPKKRKNQIGFEELNSDKHGKIALSLVRQLLESAGMKHTLSVFDAESGTSSEKQEKDDQLDTSVDVIYSKIESLQVLYKSQVNFSSPLKNAANQGLPLLVGMLHILDDPKTTFENEVTLNARSRRRMSGEEMSNGSSQQQPSEVKITMPTTSTKSKKDKEITITVIHSPPRGKMNTARSNNMDDNQPPPKQTSTTYKLDDLSTIEEVSFLSTSSALQSPDKQTKAAPTFNNEKDNIKKDCEPTKENMAKEEHPANISKLAVNSSLHATPQVSSAPPQPHPPPSHPSHVHQVAGYSSAVEAFGHRVGFVSSPRKLKQDINEIRQSSNSLDVPLPSNSTPSSLNQVRPSHSVPSSSPMKTATLHFSPGGQGEERGGAFHHHATSIEPAMKNLNEDHDDEVDFEKKQEMMADDLISNLVKTISAGRNGDGESFKDGSYDDSSDDDGGINEEIEVEVRRAAQLASRILLRKSKQFLQFFFNKFKSKIDLCKLANNSIKKSSSLMFKVIFQNLAIKNNANSILKSFQHWIVFKNYVNKLREKAKQNFHWLNIKLLKKQVLHTWKQFAAKMASVLAEQHRIKMQQQVGGRALVFFMQRVFRLRVAVKFQTWKLIVKKMAELVRKQLVESVKKARKAKSGKKSKEESNSLSLSVETTSDKIVNGGNEGGDTIVSKKEKFKSPNKKPEKEEVISSSNSTSSKKISSSLPDSTSSTKPKVELRRRKSTRESKITPKNPSKANEAKKQVESKDKKPQETLKVAATSSVVPVATHDVAATAVSTTDEVSTFKKNEQDTSVTSGSESKERTANENNTMTPPPPPPSDSQKILLSSNVLETASTQETTGVKETIDEPTLVTSRPEVSNGVTNDSVSQESKQDESAIVYETVIDAVSAVSHQDGNSSAKTLIEVELTEGGNITDAFPLVDNEPDEFDEFKDARQSEESILRSSSLNAASGGGGGGSEDDDDDDDGGDKIDDGGDGGGLAQEDIEKEPQERLSIRNGGADDDEDDGSFTSAGNSFLKPVDSALVDKVADISDITMAADPSPRYDETLVNTTRTTISSHNKEDAEKREQGKQNDQKDVATNRLKLLVDDEAGKQLLDFDLKLNNSEDFDLKLDFPDGSKDDSEERDFDGSEDEGHQSSPYVREDEEVRTTDEFKNETFYEEDEEEEEEEDNSIDSETSATEDESEEETEDESEDETADESEEETEDESEDESEEVEEAAVVELSPEKKARLEALASGGWECDVCGRMNQKDKLACWVCFTKKNFTMTKKFKKAFSMLTQRKLSMGFNTWLEYYHTSVKEELKLAAAGWTCVACNRKNQLDALQCRVCLTLKYKSVPPQPKHSNAQTLPIRKRDGSILSPGSSSVGRSASLIPLVLPPKVKTTPMINDIKGNNQVSSSSPSKSSTTNKVASSMQSLMLSPPKMANSSPASSTPTPGWGPPPPSSPKYSMSRSASLMERSPVVSSQVTNSPPRNSSPSRLPRSNSFTGGGYRPQQGSNSPSRRSSPSRDGVYNASTGGSNTSNLNDGLSPPASPRTQSPSRYSSPGRQMLSKRNTDEKGLSPSFREAMAKFTNS